MRLPEKVIAFDKRKEVKRGGLWQQILGRTVYIQEEERIFQEV